MDESEREAIFLMAGMLELYDAVYPYCPECLQRHPKDDDCASVVGDQR